MVDIIESVCLTVVINFSLDIFHFGFLALFRCAFLKTKHVSEVQQGSRNFAKRVETPRVSEVGDPCLTSDTRLIFKKWL